MESLILKEVMNREGEWETWFSDTYPDIKINRDGNFAIFNYGITSNFSNPIVQEARGIIIDIVSKEVVCWPFRKFGKYTDSYADNIDWATAEVQEKLDGSIIKLWFNKYLEKWQFSTNGTINAKNAIVSIRYGDTNFQDLIDRAISETSPINYNILDKNCTYIFELTGVENRVVVHYNECKLWAIGARNNITGEEFIPDIGVERPRSFSISNLDECITYLDNQHDSNSKIKGVELEGFVVVDSNWNRVKIKTPMYMVIHGLLDNSKTSKYHLIDYILRDKVDVGELCRQYPNVESVIKWYDYQLSQFLYDVRSLIDISTKMVKIYEGDMRIIGKLLSRERCSRFAFDCIKSGKTYQQIMDDMTIDTIIRFIPDYPKPNRSYLLQYREE